VIGEDEAAAILDVSDRTLRKLRQTKQIPFGLVGGQIRYVRSTLIEWIKAGGSNQKESV
jgi:excisionase family DNA binding protein